MKKKENVEQGRQNEGGREVNSIKRVVRVVLVEKVVFEKDFKEVSELSR